MQWVESVARKKKLFARALVSLDATALTGEPFGESQLKRLSKIKGSTEYLTDCGQRRQDSGDTG